MKMLKLLTLFSFSSTLSLYSCGSDSSNTSNADTTDAEAAQPPAPDASLTPAPGTDAAANLPGSSLQTPVETQQPAAAKPAAGGALHHYVCPKNCKGSGGDAQANCPTCGTAYVHNQAFHGTPAAAPAPAPTGGNNPAAATPPPSPAKNAAGVFHYTCPKGCAGGAAGAGKCAKCGGDLAHNQAYHQ